MSLDGISILMDPTSAAWTGGTATSFENDGTPVATGIHIADVAETDFRLRKHITFKNRNPVRQSDGTYSKGRRDVIITVPIELESGDYSFQVSRVTFELHPEITSAQLANLRHFTAQAILDSESDNFWNYGSTK